MLFSILNKSIYKIPLAQVTRTYLLQNASKENNRISLALRDALKSFRKGRHLFKGNFRSKKSTKLLKKLTYCGSALLTVNCLQFSKHINAYCEEQNVWVPDVEGQKFKEEESEVKYDSLSEFIKTYILPQFFPLVLAVLSALGAATINIQIPAILGQLVTILSREVNNRLSLSDYVNLIHDSSSRLLMLYLCQGALTFICISLLSNIGERIACEMRKDLLKSLLRQDIAFYDVHRSGELIDRLTSDVQDFKSSFKLCISQGLRSTSQTIGCVVSLYKISPKLTLLMTAVIPLLVLVGALVGASLRHYSRRSQEQMAVATSYASEAVGNMRTVRAFDMEDTEYEKYSTEIEKAKDLNQALGIGIGAFQGVTNIALNGIVLGMIYCGGFLVTSHGLKPGELMSFLVASQMVQRSLASISLLFGSTIRGVSAATRVMEYITLEPELIQTGTKKIPYHSLLGELKLHNVAFSYPSRPESQVLRNMTLKLPPCKVVALCGLSGGGKSTVASLIERFYDPDSGKITLDGIDIRDLDVSWLRERVIGYINQEPALFNNTILENIRYGKPEATDEEIIQAAKLANADDFITRFPDGYQTHVGERGTTLSGGQKQRIAIARALIKNPAILILDEATSALDAESEKLVQDALDRVMIGRTVLVIAHRLSTIQNADVIAVISNGEIAEIGTHFELLRTKGIYSELIRRQAMLS